MASENVKKAVLSHCDVDLPEPEPLIEATEPQQPYPLQALGVIMADAVSTYQQYGQQPIPLVACSALSAASLSTQGLVNVGRDHNLIGPVSLNMALIAQSGERKTSADRRMFRPVRNWKKSYIAEHADDVVTANARIAAHDAQREGLLSQIRKNAGKSDNSTLKTRLEELDRQKPEQFILPILFFEDCTPEALAQDIAAGWPSATLSSDEGGLIIGGHGMGQDSMMRYFGLLNRLWDGNPFERRRTTARSFIINGRRFTVSIMMQETVFCQLLNAGEGVSRGMGLIARFLLSWPDSTMGTRFYKDINIEGPAMEAWDERITALLSLPLPIEDKDKNMTLKPPILQLSVAAKQKWIAFHDQVEKELSRIGEWGDVNDFAAKTAENAARIAGILWTFKHGPEGEIDAATMEMGIAIASWHLTEAKRIMAAMDQPQEIADSMLLEEYLRKQGSIVKPRDILQKGPNKLRNKERRDAAIKLLTAKFRVFEEKGGLRLNPKLPG